MEMAHRFVSGFGVATECGWGRRPAATIPDLLRIHTAVTAPIQRARGPRRRFQWPAGFARVPDQDWVQQPMDTFGLRYDTVENHGWYRNLDPTVEDLARHLEGGAAARAPRRGDGAGAGGAQGGRARLHQRHPSVPGPCRHPRVLGPRAAAGRARLRAVGQYP